MWFSAVPPCLLLLPLFKADQSIQTQRGLLSNQACFQNRAFEKNFKRKTLELIAQRPEGARSTNSTGGGLEERIEGLQRTSARSLSAN